METITAAVRRLYQKDLEAVYEQAIYLSCEAGTVKRERLQDVIMERRPRDIFIVRVDHISQRLAFIQAEYVEGGKYHTEIVGAICCQKNWKAVCMLSGSPQHRFEFLYGKDDELQLVHLRRIGTVLLKYCEDVYRMDADDCLQLFWPQARMYHPNEGESFTDVPIQVLYDRWKDIPKPEEVGAEKFSRIYHIELLDDKTAVAKVGCAKLDCYFKDYLFLMYIRDQWVIVNKMTHGLYQGERI